MTGRRRNGGRRFSLKKAILFLSIFSGLTREVRGTTGAAVAIPRNSLGAGNMGRRTDAMPPALYVPQNNQLGWFASLKTRTGKAAKKTANTASVVGEQALRATEAAAIGAANAAQGAANLASAAAAAAETLKDKSPEVTAVSIDTAIAVATALQWLCRYGTGIFLYMCFVTFVAEDTLLLLENTAVLNRLTVPGRERAYLIMQRSKLWDLRIRSLSNRSVNRSAVESLIADAQQLIKDHDEARILYRRSRETKASKFASAVRTTAGVVTGGLIPLPRRNRLQSGSSRANAGTSPPRRPTRAKAGTSPRKSLSPAKSNSNNNNNMGMRRLFQN